MDREEFSKTDMGDKLIEAVKRGDPALIALRIQELVGMIRRDEVDEPFVLESLKVLQSGRRFDSMVEVAEAIVSREGTASPATMRRYAQALIERGALSGADCILQRVQTDPGDQLEELIGLRGRVAKQRYINFDNRRQLVAAIREYGTAYRDYPGDNLWQGGNLLALLHRADRVGIAAPAGNPSVERLARDLLDHIESMSPATRSVWTRGTEIQALLALGDGSVAAELAATIANTKNADAFELGSLHRQLTEVWQLDPDDPVMQALETNALTIGIGVDIAVPEAGDLEKLLGRERPAEFWRYARGLEVARAVCMITDSYGAPVGTGFVLPGVEFSEKLGQDLILVTNAHVVSDTVGIGGLPANRAMARFTALPGDMSRTAAGEGEEVGGLEQIWTSPPTDLDATLLRIDAPSALISDPIVASPVQPSMADEDPFVYVVGHPRGKPLSLSIRGNELLAVNERLLHYKAPTEPGSSGSPVFDKNWDLVGLHHSGSFQMARLDNPSEHYAANEAINLASIKAALRAES